MDSAERCKALALLAAREQAEASARPTQIAAAFDKATTADKAAWPFNYQR